MKHYGDITKLKGSDLPIVDIICGGSPCQDLSIGGKRAGLQGERSGLFIEQIRVIKELRNESTRRLHSRGSAFDIRGISPRYMVWENVPGAFTSNNGEDFRAVLEETAKVKEPNAVIPRPPKKWSPSGCILGDGWSIAWRVHDAQFWGVPQRRKRIALIADFGGATAPEILFERKGMSRAIEESEGQRKDFTEDALLGFRESDSALSFQERAGKPGGGKGILIQYEHVGALSTLVNQFVCYRKKTHPHNATEGQGWEETTIADTLNVNDNSELRASVFVVDKDIPIVRRMTPLEYERLQGYPDNWTNIGEWVDSKGKKHKDADSPRYKALGNSIALPFWEWMAKRMVHHLGVKKPTMASLFDGIGGFPLVFSRSGCEPIWASEIEEFPIAVTKLRFPEEERG